MVSRAITGWAHAHFPVELLTPREMAEADRLAAQSTPSLTLMERAGEAIAAAAGRLVEARVAADGPATGHVLVLCGPGNNGGDGYVAARLLAEAGHRVTVAALGTQDSLVTQDSLGMQDALRGDAAAAAARWTGPVVPLAEAQIGAPDVIVDGLFGAGLSRDIDGIAKTAIERVNRWARDSGRPVLAIDVPSGIDGTSGAIRGVAIEATQSITFFRLKPGHVLLPGRLHCGAVTLADIGIACSVLDEIKPLARLNAPALWARAYPVPSLAGHKYARGHAVVVSGPLAQTGAARLCARGALRAGAGLVTVATPADALAVHAAALTAIMTRVADGPEALTQILGDARKNAIVMGPGLGVGAPTRALVLAALKPIAPEATPRRVVLDADALASFSEQPAALFEAIEASGHVVALTPHDGEFAKLFGGLLDLSQAKPKRTRAAALISGAIVILKGADTVVAHPDGRVAIAASEAPWLATAGSGDVLAGMITGLLAQAMAPFAACAAGVWMHAEAARLFGPGLIAEDIPEMLPRVLSDLLGHHLIDRM